MRKLTDQNRLSLTHPEIAAQWHPTKNEPLTPHDVSIKSGKKVWWLCQAEDDHEWEARVFERTAGSGCSCCANKTVVMSNCLETTHPNLAADWNYRRNGSLTPRDVVAGSEKKVWWVCSIADDHEWEATVNNRVNGKGCSCCRGRTVVKSNCLETTHPNLAGEWHPDKNWPLTPSDVFAGSVKKFWWKCPVGGHEWLATVAYRSKGSGCPICRESKGEKLIASVLTEMGYPFERQVRFDGCKSEQRLFFDFLVWLSDGAYVLIEYNGQQHYEPQRWGSSMSDEKIEGRFEEAQKRDQIKEQWAKDNGVSLLVIPYWDIDKIETLIEEFISQHTGVLDHEEATEAHQDGLQPQA